jgi:hypothetical protein
MVVLVRLLGGEHTGIQIERQYNRKSDVSAYQKDDDVAASWPARP